MKIYLTLNYDWQFIWETKLQRTCMELNIFLIHTKFLQLNCITCQYNWKNLILDILQRFISVSRIYSNNCLLKWLKRLALSLLKKPEAIICFFFLFSFFLSFFFSFYLFFFFFFFLKGSFIYHVHKIIWKTNTPWNALVQALIRG